jgi:hypothetical protein
MCVLLIEKQTSAIFLHVLLFFDSYNDTMLNIIVFLTKFTVF